jgi:hypothetical protein
MYLKEFRHTQHSSMFRHAQHSSMFLHAQHNSMFRHAQHSYVSKVTSFGPFLGHHQNYIPGYICYIDDCVVFLWVLVYRSDDGPKKGAKVITLDL